MKQELSVSIGQYSSAGRKNLNQDFHGAFIPTEPMLSTKGIAVAIADGISSSDVSQIASETAVSGFFNDYYSTSESWSIKKSAHRVLQATNSWLYAQSRNSPYRFNKDKGYICTFSALVIKSNSAYIFHAGDSRIYHLSGADLEQLTEDHRYALNEDSSYLTRALGIHQTVDLEYRTTSIRCGDYFILATDGVYEFINDKHILTALQNYPDNLEQAAESLAMIALEAGSNDNLTIQLLRIDQLPDHQIDEIAAQITRLPLPPRLQARMEIDGYRIIREIHISSRSHVFLAEDTQNGDKVVLKTLSTEMASNQEHLESMLLEEWIARKINNPHVLKALPASRTRNYLYVVMEYIDGISLAQWMQDNPSPSTKAVRNIIDQIAKGLQALHRQEIVHQDLRPNNVLIDKDGTVKLIDFGAARVAGISEISTLNDGIVGTMAFTAPEYFRGMAGTGRSDIFSLGVIAYQMFSGRLPYGNDVSKAHSVAAQRKLQYRSVITDDCDIPEWMDAAIHKAVRTDPFRRYQEVSEFAYDLRHANKQFLNEARAPMLDRNPLLFWQGICALLLLIIIVQNTV